MVHFAVSGQVYSKQSQLQLRSWQNGLGAVKTVRDSCSNINRCKRDARHKAPDIPCRMHDKSTWGERELLALIDSAANDRHRPSGPWIEYLPGDGQLVIAAPHDGMCCPRTVSKREEGVTVRDTGTKGLAAAIALEVVRTGAPRPHLLVCHLSRTRIDVNRERDRGAQHPLAEQAWDFYHDLLARACAAAAAVSPGGALFLDVHAQSNWRKTNVEAIELGTLSPNGKDLSKGWNHLATLGSDWLENLSFRVLPGELGQHQEHEVTWALFGKFTMPRLAAHVLISGGSLADLLCGEYSLGTLLSKQGYKAVPSAELPRPPVLASTTSGTNASYIPEEQDEDSEDEENSDWAAPYFCGSTSYTLRETHLVLDSIQMEFPSSLSKQESNWRPLATAVVSALQELWWVQLQHELLPQLDPQQAVDAALLSPGGLGKAYRLWKSSGTLISIKQKDRLRMQRYEAMKQELDNSEHAMPFFISKNKAVKLYQIANGCVRLVVDITREDSDLLKEIICWAEPDISRTVMAINFQVYRDRPDAVRADAHYGSTVYPFFGDLVNDLEEPLGAASMMITRCGSETCFVDNNGEPWPPLQGCEPASTHYKLWYPHPGGGIKYREMKQMRLSSTDPNDLELLTTYLCEEIARDFQQRMETASKIQVESSFGPFYEEVLNSIDMKTRV